MPMMALLLIHWSMASAWTLYPSVHCITLALWHCQPLTRGRLWVIGFHSFSRDRSLVNVSILLMMWFDVLCVYKWSTPSLSHGIVKPLLTSEVHNTCQNHSLRIPSGSDYASCLLVFPVPLIFHWVNSALIVSIIEAWCSVKMCSLWWCACLPLEHHSGRE